MRNYRFGSIREREPESDTDDASLFYPLSKIVDVSSGDDRAINSKQDSLEQVIALYEKSTANEDDAADFTSVVLKNENVTTTVATEAQKEHSDQTDKVIAIADCRWQAQRLPSSVVRLPYAQSF